MEENKKQIDITKLVFVILLIIILMLCAFLVWSSYTNNLYKEYEPIYSENCYKVNNDENSITITTYYKNGDIIYSSEKNNFKDGKLISCSYQEAYKNRALAKNRYEKLKNENSSAKLNKENIVDYEQKPNNFDKDDINQKELIEKIESFTTNKEIIDFVLENGNEYNFGISDSFKKIN